MNEINLPVELRDPIEFPPDDYDVCKINPKHFGSVAFYRITDNEQYNKFIENLTKKIRRGFSYKRLMQFHKSCVNWQQSKYLQNIPPGSVDIEIHHHPFTLFEIVDVMARFLAASQKKNPKNIFSSQTISHEVMRIHCADSGESRPEMVGLVPLTVTEHELVHSNALLLSPDCVTQRVDLFLKIFRDYIPMAMLNKVERLLSLTEAEIRQVNENILRNVDLNEIMANDRKKMQEIRALLHYPANA